MDGAGEILHALLAGAGAPGGSRLSEFAAAYYLRTRLQPDRVSLCVTTDESGRITRLWFEPRAHASRVEQLEALAMAADDYLQVATRSLDRQLVDRRRRALRKALGALDTAPPVTDDPATAVVAAATTPVLAQ